MELTREAMTELADIAAREQVQAPSELRHRAVLEHHGLIHVTRAGAVEATDFGLDAVEEGPDEFLAGHEMAQAAVRDKVVKAAREDAKLFTDELPGDWVMGDWDSQAWQETASRLNTWRDPQFPARWWDTYYEALHVEVGRLRAEAES
jgi:hypothetical protein